MSNRKNVRQLTHGGDWAGYTMEYGCDPLDFSMNVNPLGVSAEVRAAVAKAVETADRYPDPLCRALVQRLALHEQVPPERIFCGAGAADLIFRLALALKDVTAAEAQDATAAEAQDVTAAEAQDATAAEAQNATAAFQETLYQRGVNAEPAVRGKEACEAESESRDAAKPETGLTRPAGRRPRLLVTAPTFSEYETAFRANGWDVEYFLLREETGFQITEEILDRIGPSQGRTVRAASDCVKEEHGSTAPAAVGVDAVFLCEPNNPTGVATEGRLLQRIWERCRQTGTTLLVDECFNGFLDVPEGHTMKHFLGQAETSGAEPPTVRDAATRDAGDVSFNTPVVGHAAGDPSSAAAAEDGSAYHGETGGSARLVILKAFTKLYGMAGLRLGYCLCSDPDLTWQLRQAGPPWNVSSLAQEAGIAALEDQDHVDQGLAIIREERPWLKTQLEELGIRRVYGEANYLLFRWDRENEATDRRIGSGTAERLQSRASRSSLKQNSDRPDLKEAGPDGSAAAAAAGLDTALRVRGILIRNCSNYPGLGRGWYRIAVRTHEENVRLVEALREILQG